MTVFTRGKDAVACVSDLPPAIFTSHFRNGKGSENEGNERETFIYSSLRRNPCERSVIS